MPPQQSNLQQAKKPDDASKKADNRAHRSDHTHQQSNDVMRQSQSLQDSRIPLDQRRQQALNLNRTLGNRLVQRFLRRSTSTVQRFWNDEMTASEIIASNDSDNINWTNMDNIRRGTVDQRIIMIHMLHNNLWVGSNDEYLIEAIWESLGAAQIAKYPDLFTKSMEYGLELDNLKCLEAYSLANASDETLAGVIKMVLNLGWVGPFDEWYLEYLWRAMEDEGISDNIDLLQKTIDRGVNIDNIPRFDQLRKNFAKDTKALATHYLTENQAIVVAEMEKMGIDAETGQNNIPDADQEAHLKEVQEMAGFILGAKEAIRALDNLQVGWKMDYQPNVGDAVGSILPAHATAYKRTEVMSPYDAMEGTGKFRQAVVPHYFKEGPPPFKEPSQDDPSVHDYDEIKAHRDNCYAILDGLMQRYPGLYTLALNDRLSELVEQDSPGQIQAMMSETLGKLHGKIGETKAEIDSGGLDWQDLVPIHSQLKSGKKVEGSTDTDWSTKFAQLAMAKELEDHETKDLLISLGLTTVGALAFLFASLATGGLAGVLFVAGVASGATQAAMSIDKYLTMDTAHDATVHRNSELISSGQVNSALIGAALDTVFVFLDVAGPLTKAAKLGWKSAKTAMDVIPVDAAAKEVGQAIEQNLAKDLAQVSAGSVSKESVQTLGDGIAKLGIGKTSQLSGLTPSQMLEIMEKTAADSAMTKRLRDFVKMQPMSFDDIAKYSDNFKLLLKDLRKGDLSRQQVDDITSYLIELEGPMEVIKRAGGWKVLNNPEVLGKGSAAGKKLEAWRQSLVKEVDDYIAEQFGGSTARTGSPGHLSDLDSSQLGKTAGDVTGLEAAAHREKAASFLAGRLGVDPSDLNRLLDTDLFIDPRRSHMYDEIFKEMPELRAEAAQKAASFEQELIYNMRHKNALKNKDKWLAQEILAEMEELGIQRMKIPNLTPEMVVQLNRQIDGLTQELADAMKLGDIAEAKRLVLEISNKQAMINAAETGGYFSGGGVRSMVSERDAFGNYIPFKHEGTGAILGEMAGREMHKSQMFTGMLDQLLKLDKYAQTLVRQSSHEIKDLPDVLKNIGKYGQRFQDLAVRANMDAPLKDLKKLANLAEEFGEILKGSKTLPAGKEAAEDALEELAKRARTALTELNSAQLTLLKQLQKEAGIHGMSGAADAYATLSRTHLVWLSAKDNAYELIRDFVLAYAKQGVQKGAQHLANDAD